MKTKLPLLPLITAMAVSFGAIPKMAAQQGPLSIQLVTTFDYPGVGNSTVAHSINTRGDITGYYTAPNGVIRGFVRYNDGTFSPPIAESQGVEGVTEARGINAGGLVCGFYFVNKYAHGFFLQGQTFTEYVVPGAATTLLEAINNHGDFTGGYENTDPLHAFQAFVTRNGIVNTIDIPNSRLAVAYAINNRGDAAGNTYDYLTLFQHGFLFDRAGNLAVFDPPGSYGTVVFAVNDQDLMVGNYFDQAGLEHGFLAKLPSTFVTFDIPGAVQSSLNGINDRGMLAGTYQDSAGLYHSFAAQLVGAVE